MNSIKSQKRSAGSANRTLRRANKADNEHISKDMANTHNARSMVIQMGKLTNHSLLANSYIPKEKTNPGK